LEERPAEDAPALRCSCDTFVAPASLGCDGEEFAASMVSGADIRKTSVKVKKMRIMEEGLN